MRRATIAMLLMLVCSSVVPANASAQDRASLPDLEDEVMCPVCREPLSVADSPQATRERAFIRRLIARGDDKTQIKAALVREYGASVLAEPSDRGFGRAAYVVPVVAVLLCMGVLVLGQRRRARPTGNADPEVPPIPASDARRLDAELRRFDADE
jgi:cytochrome c-type biogenesis protein CcmH